MCWCWRWRVSWDGDWRRVRYGDVWWVGLSLWFIIDWLKCNVGYCEEGLWWMYKDFVVRNGGKCGYVSVWLLGVWFFEILRSCGGNVVDWSNFFFMGGGDLVWFFVVVVLLCLWVVDVIVSNRCWYYGLIDCLIDWVFWCFLLLCVLIVYVI